MEQTEATLDAYYASLAPERRDDLLALRRLVLGTWPCTEDMALDMPTFHLHGKPLFAVASHKHFMALYVVPYDLLEVFKNDLMVFDRGRSCIRFKRLEPETLILFDRIIKYVGDQKASSKATAKHLVPKRQLARS